MRASSFPDGKTLWFYNPFVEQATATWLKDATSNTPFMLIARNQSSDWQQYNIKQNGDDFVLTPKSGSGNLKQFTINVGRDGTIHQFSAVEQDDQRSSYQLKSQQNGAVDAAKFTFTPPKGVTVDDQRKVEAKVSNLSLDFSDNAFQPLAARMRPEKFSAVYWPAAPAGAG